MKLPIPTGWRRLLSSAGLASLLLSSTTAQAQQVQSYIFRTATTTFTPISGTGVVNVANLRADDAISSAITIPFPFIFDGVSYSAFKACSNGWLTFNTSTFSTSIDNNLDNGPASDRPLVAPFWDDLTGTGTGSAASYVTTGTAGSQVLTFQWLNWARYGTNGPTISFQVQLFEGTNEVRFVYRREVNAFGTGAGASIGLSGNGSGTNSFLSLNNAVTNPTASSLTETDNISVFPASGQVYRFTPQPANTCATPRNLTASVNSTTAAATLNWQALTGTGPYTVTYGVVGFDPTSTTGSTQITNITGTSTTINGLTPNSYQFYVSQTCGTSTSNLSSVGGFDIACPSPTSPTVGTVTPTTAAISYFSSASTGSTFNIIYGPPGFSSTGTGPNIVRVTGITGTSTTLTNLTPNTSYSFYVQQVCVNGSTGATLAGPISFATPVQPPANDEPCGAIALGTTTTNATNFGANTSAQPGISTPGCSPSQVPKDVWFTYAPSAGTNSMTLTFTGTVVGQVRVYTTPSCSAGPFTQVFCRASTGNNVGFSAPITVPNLTPGTTYYISVSGYGSSDTTGPFTVAVTSALASRAQMEAAALLVYPNPSSTGEISLRLDQATGSGQATLLNTLGQVVATKALTGKTGEYTLSTHNLAAGLYTLRVEGNGRVLTRKVVLE